ncbi:MAG: ABC transporter ATP-binding protein [Proteobacteria bacterium]|nr:ABC transporter ATP-binding protein [Pseudomonadota bacterium]
MGLLGIENIRIHYGRVEAVKGVSLEVQEDTIVSLIGANGAGKTTILRAVFGLNKPTSGEIHFGGQKIDGKSPPEIAKKGIAYSLEGRKLFPLMTVYENLEMGAYLRKDKAGIRQDIEDIFQLFPILGDRLNQDAGTLSGGEQQMLAIARALMSKPRLLLLDEPSLGLAPLIVRELGSIIKKINQQGVAILLVEQNTKLGLGIAQQGYVLEVGLVALHGDAQKLLNDEHVKKVYLGG